MKSAKKQHPWREYILNMDVGLVVVAVVFAGLYSVFQTRWFPSPIAGASGDFVIACAGIGGLALSLYIVRALRSLKAESQALHTAVHTLTGTITAEEQRNSHLYEMTCGRERTAAFWANVGQGITGVLGGAGSVITTAVAWQENHDKNNSPPDLAWLTARTAALPVSNLFGFTLITIFNARNARVRAYRHMLEQEGKIGEMGAAAKESQPTLRASAAAAAHEQAAGTPPVAPLPPNESMASEDDSGCDRPTLT